METYIGWSLNYFEEYTTESPVCFRGVRGSTCSQVAVTVTSYSIAERARFFVGQSPDESFYCCSSRKHYVNGV